MKTISIHDFILRERAHLLAFSLHWKEGMTYDKKLFPLKLSHAEWKEQMEFYKEKNRETH